MTLYRGKHALTSQNGMAGRDFTAEQIARHFGGEVLAYRVPAEELETAPRYSHGRPYEFLLYAPGSYGTSWTAFHDEAGLEAWLDAYGCTADPDRPPGKLFTIYLPSSYAAMLPLRSGAPASV